MCSSDLPGSQSGLSNFQNIIGTDGFNLDPALASDTSGNALAVWVYADSSDIVNLTVPGTFYTDDQKTIIGNTLSASDIYYSYWDGASTQWSIANFVASEQPGTDSNVTVGYDPINKTYLAAWLNTQTDSATNEETITIYWASYEIGRAHV